MESLNDESMHEQQQQRKQGKGKQLRDSNVTVIQVFPSERANRRIDKVVRRMDSMQPVASETSNLEVLTLTPFTRDSQTSDGQFMKLHIINVRTGKIQDAIMLTTSGNHHHDEFALKPKAFHRKQTPSKSEIKSRLGTNSGTKEIIRVQPLHSHRPETTWNEINNNNKKLKPYKLRNKFLSKCKCEDNSLLWSCKKIQISIAQCKSSQFMCCSF